MYHIAMKTNLIKRVLTTTSNQNLFSHLLALRRCESKKIFFMHLMGQNGQATPRFLSTITTREFFKQIA